MYACTTVVRRIYSTRNIFGPIKINRIDESIVAASGAHNVRRNSIFGICHIKMKYIEN